MNLNLTEDQQQIRETVKRLVRDQYSHQHRLKYLQEPDGWSRGMWTQYADLGLAGLCVAEDFGGVEGTAIDRYVVFRELGRASVLEPLLASCIVSACAIGYLATPEQKEKLLPTIANGHVVVGWAHGDAEIDGDTKAVMNAEDSTWRLSGTKSMVLQAASSDHFIVSAVLETGEPGLFLVERSATGLMLANHQLLDGTRASDLTLVDASGQLLGTSGQAASDTVGRAEAAGMAAVCADAVGAMQAALEATISYLDARSQFGKPLSANQALRHRVADMAVQVECADSMAMLAAMAIQQPQACELGDLRAAKVVVGKYGRWVCEQAIQLHGGIGMTEEYSVGKYLQRILVMEQLFGSPETHLATLNTMHAH